MHDHLVSTGDIGVDFLSLVGGYDNAESAALEARHYLATYGRDPEIAIRDLAARHRLVCLGEMHNQPGRILSSELVAAAAKAGASALFVEVDVGLQPQIDQWMRSGLRTDLPQTVGGGEGPLYAFQAPYYEMLQTARHCGMRVVAIDAEYADSETRNATMAERICMLLGRDPALRAVAVVGQLHLVPRPFWICRRSMAARIRDHLGGEVITIGRAVPLTDRPEFSGWACVAATSRPLLLRVHGSPFAELAGSLGRAPLLGNDFDYLLFYNLPLEPVPSDYLSTVGLQ